MKYREIMPTAFLSYLLMFGFSISFYIVYEYVLALQGIQLSSSVGASPSPSDILLFVIIMPLFNECILRKIVFTKLWDTFSIRFSVFLVSIIHLVINGIIDQDYDLNSLICYTLLFIESVLMCGLFYKTGSIIPGLITQITMSAIMMSIMYFAPLTSEAGPLSSIETSSKLFVAITFFVGLLFGSVLIRRIKLLFTIRP